MIPFARIKEIYGASKLGKELRGVVTF